MRITITNTDGSKSCGLNLPLTAIQIRSPSTYAVLSMHWSDVDMCVEALDLEIEEDELTYITGQGWITYEKNEWNCWIVTS